MIKICRKCEEEFNDKEDKHRGGYIDVCGFCAKEDVQKTLGFIATNGKSNYETHIVVNPTSCQIAQIKAHGKSTAKQCHTALGMGSYKAASEEDLDREDKADKKHLYIEHQKEKKGKWNKK